jgi:hypothetical protein
MRSVAFFLREEAAREKPEASGQEAAAAAAKAPLLVERPVL